jgi:ABC-type nitrate/sulfonate/bicarbonate transport system ATPase subunit
VTPTPIGVVTRAPIYKTVAERKLTALLVTHDPVEAVMLRDRLSGNQAIEGLSFAKRVRDYVVHLK